MNFSSAVIRSSAIPMLLCGASMFCHAQGLSPRAYVVAPIHSNAINVTYQLQDGDVVFDATLPIQDAHGRIGIDILSFFHTLNFFGRSSSLTASLPYAVGHFQGVVNNVPLTLYRSGLAPTTIRFSANVWGAPAMEPERFVRWRQKLLIGISLTVNTPTGQYDGTRLINTGDNRWAFKPEVGLSRRWGHWIFDAYGAVWLFTANNDFYSRAPGSHGPNLQTQAPMGATELHLSYDVKPRLWISLDGNYWYGGQTSLNGVTRTTTLQANSRLGVTASFPITSHQSIKASYNRGAYVRFGGNFQNLSVGWQYSWLRRPS